MKRLRRFVPEGGRFTFIPAEWVERLSPSVLRLKETLKVVAQDVRENQLALEHKTKSIKEYEFAFQAVANFLTGLFAAAGREDLAKRVRPSTRRPGQTAELAPNVSGAEGSDESEQEDTQETG